MKTKLIALALTSSAMIPASLTAQEDGSQWRLSLEATPLQPITLPAPAVRSKFRTYWYTIVTVTNKTGAAHDLVLGAQARLGTKKILDPKTNEKVWKIARPGLLPNVTQEIAKRERRPLDNILAADGSIDDGQKKSFVVVFAHLPRTASHIDLRINGLANSLYKVGKSMWIEKTEASIRFHRIGDEYDVTREPVRVVGTSYETVETKLIRKYTPKKG